MTCLTGEVTHSNIKSILHAHADQDIVQVILLLHLESRQAHIHLIFYHHVWTRPLVKFFIGQRLLQLVWIQFQLLVCLLKHVYLFTVFVCLSYLLQACGVILYLVRQEDEHAEVVPFVGHL